MNIRNTLPGILIIVFLGSCIPNKKIVYMQDIPSSELVTKTRDITPYQIEDYRLQAGDVVDITIKTTSVELNEILRVRDNQNQIRNMEGLTSGDAFFLNGYTVDEEGNVDLPLIGQLKLVSITSQQAKQAIEQKMEKYISKDNYFVQVRLGGIRYSALGEFGRPGKYTILQNRATIFDAIANAGDLTQTAKRNEVLLVRQYPEGTKTHTINLLSDKIVESEFFFIRQNDILYAKPMRVKQLGTGITVAQSLQLLLSVLTVVVLIANAN